MKKTLIIAAAAMLIGSSGLSFAGSTKGASGFAPGTQMNNSTTTITRGVKDRFETTKPRPPSRGFRIRAGYSVATR